MWRARWTRHALLCVLVGCSAAEDSSVTAFIGARLIDGTGADPVASAVLIVRNGRIDGVGPDLAIPPGAMIVNLRGRWVVPGFINAHGHVGATATADSGAPLTEALAAELRQYAWYGITTVNSLGGEGPEAIALRDAQAAPGFARARLFVSGEVVGGETVQAVVETVDANHALGVDFIKIRVDDNLGASTKMPPDVYQAVIDRAHEHGLPVAAHLFYLEDAKRLLQAGADLVAHSVRDVPVDDAAIQLFRERDICYVPTLAREVSTFVYESVPDFFDDPFFAAADDPVLVAALRRPESQRRYRESSSAQAYKRALAVASDNLAALAGAGVTIAFGTDTGPRARFQGFFEHLEMDLMTEAGLAPAEILGAATREAARCLGLDDLGTLERGKWADFVVLRDDPLQDIRNMRSIQSVWIAGHEVAR